MIDQLFEGKTESAKVRFKSLLEKIGQAPNIAWYPSAGMDFRDLIEVHKTDIIPDIHFHTDYSLRNKLEIGEIFNDNTTKVSIKNIEELKFKKHINYNVDPGFVAFAPSAPDKPLLFLLDMVVECATETIERPVLYIYMENIHFLDNIALKEKLPISHLIKVREGCGFGGNRQSITIAYDFIRYLNIKYLLIDKRINKSSGLVWYLSRKHRIQYTEYSEIDLVEINNIQDWSGFRVKVKKVNHTSNEAEYLQNERTIGKDLTR